MDIKIHDGLTVGDLSAMLESEGLELAVRPPTSTRFTDTPYMVWVRATREERPTDYAGRGRTFLEALTNALLSVQRAS